MVFGACGEGRNHHPRYADAVICNLRRINFCRVHRLFWCQNDVCQSFHLHHKRSRPSGISLAPAIGKIYRSKNALQTRRKLPTVRHQKQSQQSVVESAPGRHMFGPVNYYLLIGRV